MRRHWILLGILVLILPVLFLGCAGSDGAAGAAGAAGPPGPPGAPGTGVQANETCVVCHAAGRVADVATMHGIGVSTGTVTANITSAAFPLGGNASVTFTFAATDASGNPVNVNLAAGSGNLTYLRLTLARLVPGQVYPTTGRDPDSWFFYGARSHRYASGMESLGGGTYRFTFDNTAVLASGWNGYTHRVGIEIYGLPGGLRSVNPTFDFVPNQGAGPYTFAQTRDIVTTAACNECHNPLGYTPSFHGSRRVETKHCVLCHNPNNPLAPQSVAPGAPDVPIPFYKLVHGIHTSQNLLVFEDGENHGDFTEVTYPQDILNCNKCHKGTEGQYWNTRPSIDACGSCHTEVNFATGANHTGGPQADNSLCAICHPPSGGLAGIIDKHRTTTTTPNNPLVPANLANFEYRIDSVTVDNNAAVVTFNIKKDGVDLNLSTYPPTGFTGGPSFLVGYALPQDGVSAPADYNNLGRRQGQPASVTLASVVASRTGTPAAYTVRLSSAPFPAGATMRAVALQSYFTQTGVDLDGNINTPPVNVARYTPSVEKAVTGDAVRRQIVQSRYNPTTGAPEGCLACHESLRLHGGSRVNNVQVCVFCHNPNNSSSGRTIDPATQTINPNVIAAVGSDPLVYPEAVMNFKELVHGVHAATSRPYEFVRNRTSGGLTGFYYNWSEVTFPGNLMDCTKCHIGTSYMPNALPAGLLLSTERTTSGDLGETLAVINAARDSVPNTTDLVNSPTASACYYCHDSGVVADHFRLNGGVIRSTRGDALFTP